MRPLVTEVFLRTVIWEPAQIRDVKVDEPACRPGSVISHEG